MTHWRFWSHGACRSGIASGLPLSRIWAARRLSLTRGVIARVRCSQRVYLLACLHSSVPLQIMATLPKLPCSIVRMGKGHSRGKAQDSIISAHQKTKLLSIEQGAFGRPAGPDEYHCYISPWKSTFCVAKTAQAPWKERVSALPQERCRCGKGNQEQADGLGVFQYMR